MLICILIPKKTMTPPPPHDMFLFTDCFLSDIKVGVSVKFNGQSGVQVRTPSNLADMAAYTSMKFYITVPDGARKKRQDTVKKQFVFYLGNKNVSIIEATQIPSLC